jgi:hypothetical protein
MSNSAETITAVYSNHAHALGAGRSPQDDEIRKSTDELVDVACAIDITAIGEGFDVADGEGTFQNRPARKGSEGSYGQTTAATSVPKMDRPVEMSKFCYIIKRSTSTSIPRVLFRFVCF